MIQASTLASLMGTFVGARWAPPGSLLAAMGTHLPFFQWLTAFQEIDLTPMAPVLSVFRKTPLGYGMG